MAITVQPVNSEFVAEIGDVDLSRPLAAEDWDAIYQAFARYSVLVFCDQSLDEDQHLAFAKRFGPIETSIAVHHTDTKMRIRPDLVDISNLDADGKIWGKDSRIRMHELGNRLWHTDSSFKRIPARASLLYARSIPPVGGRTEFADARAAYDALSDEMKARIDGLVAEHSIFNSRARIGFTDFLEEERRNLPPVPQTLVRVHPDSGRKSIYVASHAGRILGMPEAEGRALVDELLEHVAKRQFVYSHRWRVGDLVMWDNRCVLHRATEYDDLRYPRDMLRATVSDEINSCERAGVAVPA
ncbi:MAG: TauD/TfdA family dioxygenase [Ectothiorhodospiraceae bacterium]|nr:TauD/TfdA family dioxygenase [Chromatiales bacterium]MCP5154186.1 TauD/TfdA family dioxygenase [Ectothiorhodospiraceae bacterium]